MRKDPFGGAPVGTGWPGHEAGSRVGGRRDVWSDGRRQMDQRANELAMRDGRVKEITVVLCDWAQGHTDDGRSVSRACSGHAEPLREFTDMLGCMDGDGAIRRMVDRQAEKLLEFAKAPKFAFGAEARDDAGFERGGAAAQDAVVDVDAEDSEVRPLVVNKHAGVRGKRAKAKGLQVGAKLEGEVASALLATTKGLTESEESAGGKAHACRRTDACGLVHVRREEGGRDVKLAGSQPTSSCQRENEAKRRGAHDRSVGFVVVYTRTLRKPSSAKASFTLVHGAVPIPLDLVNKFSVHDMAIVHDGIVTAPGAMDDLKDAVFLHAGHLLALSSSPELTVRTGHGVLVGSGMVIRRVTGRSGESRTVAIGAHKPAGEGGAGIVRNTGHALTERERRDTSKATDTAGRGGFGPRERSRIRRRTRRRRPGSGSWGKPRQSSRIRVGGRRRGRWVR